MHTNIRMQNMRSAIRIHYSHTKGIHVQRLLCLQNPEMQCFYCAIKTQRTLYHPLSAVITPSHQELGAEVVPPYMIASKEAVKEKATPIWTKKSVPTVTESYHSYMINVSPASEYEGLRNIVV